MKRQPGWRQQAAAFFSANVLIVVPVSAAETILCTAKGQSNIVLTLKAEKRLGRMIDCISGNFISDLTPCAPGGAFGLSAPTGSAALVRIVDRWQAYANHLGGVTSHFTTAHEVYFSGGFMSPREGLKENWNFKVSRLTGVGTLSVRGQPEVIYICAKAARRF